MHLETVSEFKIMQSKKDIGYTYFRFDKNAHRDLKGCPVAAINVNGTYILIPFSKSKYKSQVITDEMIDERLNQVVQSIQTENQTHKEKGVITDPRAHSVEELQMNQEMARDYKYDEKICKMSGRSKPPSVLCGIRLSVKPGPGPDAREGPVLTCTRRDSPFHRHPRIDARRVSAREGGARPGGLGRLIAPRGAYRFCAIAMTLAIRT